MSAMMLDRARLHVSIVIRSSHLPGWKENREAWEVIDAHLTQPTQSVDVIEQVIAELRQGDLNDEECLALANQLTAALPPGASA